MSTPTPTRPAAAGPSIHVLRARRLLWGGLVGGVAAAAASLVVAGLVAGSRGVLSAVLAAGLVLFFYTVGQYVMVLFADAGARLLLAVSMASYTTRVAVIGLALLVFDQFAAAQQVVVPMVVFATTIAVVVGWLAVEVWVFSRLRVTAYDAGYDTPAGARSQP